MSNLNNSRIESNCIGGYQNFVTNRQKDKCTICINAQELAIVAVFEGSDGKSKNRLCTT